MTPEEMQEEYFKRLAQYSEQKRHADLDELRHKHELEAFQFRQRMAASMIAYNTQAAIYQALNPNLGKPKEPTKMENEFDPIKPLLPHWLQTSLTVAFWVLIVAFMVTYGPQALLDLYEVLQ